MINQSYSESLKTVGFIVANVKGTSMRPLFKEGRDKVYIVNITDATILKKGDVVLYRRDDGTLVLHRINKVLPSSFVMMGDNQNVCEYGVTSAHILGKCVGYYKWDKYIDFSKSLGYKIYKNTYVKCKFLKKVYQKFFI